MREKQWDVIVVGGGIIGISTAYFLLKKGKRVALIEKNEIGWGASGACDEMILLQSKKPGILLEMAMESLALYRHFSEVQMMDLDFVARGGTIFIENEEQLEVMEDFVKTRKKYGLDVEIIDKKDVFRKQPHVNKKIIASTYSKMDAQVSPLKVMKALIKESIKMGLEIIKPAYITEIKERKAHWEVKLNHGVSLEGEYIVNAAGAWAPGIGKMVGLDIPIAPKRGQILITEQVPYIGETNGWSAEYMAAKLNPNLLKNIDEEMKNLGVGFAFSQGPTGNCFIGSTRENMGFNKETTHRAIDLLRNQALKFFPVLSNVHIIRCIAGLRPATPDGKPIIGEVEDKSGFFMAAGHEGDGIALAPITGKVMAELINGEKTSFNMEELSLSRFSNT